MKSFNNIIQEILKYKKAVIGNTTISKVEKQMLKHLADRCVRVATHLIPPDASDKAIKRAKKHNIDLHALREKDRNKAEQIIKKEDPTDTERFILEHHLPVNEILKKLEDSVIIRLENEIKAVWVLDSEDKRLSKLGYKKKRKFPDEAYEKAGIKVISNQYGEDWMKVSWKIK
jgi:hypothetical protein